MIPVASSSMDIAELEGFRDPYCHSNNGRRYCRRWSGSERPPSLQTLEARWMHPKLAGYHKGIDTGNLRGECTRGTALCSTYIGFRGVSMMVTVTLWRSFICKALSRTPDRPPQVLAQVPELPSLPRSHRTLILSS